MQLSICFSAFALAQNYHVTSSPTSPASQRLETIFFLAYYHLHKDFQALCSKTPKCFIVSVFHSFCVSQFLWFTNGLKTKRNQVGFHSLWVSDKKCMLLRRPHRAINTLRCTAKCWKPPFYLASTTSIQSCLYTKCWEIAKMRNVFNIGCNLFCLSLIIFKPSPKNYTYIDECSPLIGLCIQNSPGNVSNPQQVFRDVIFTFRWKLCKITHCQAISC